MAAKVESIKDISRKLMTNTLTVVAAVALIKEADLVRSVVPHLPPDDDDPMSILVEDAAPPEDNDVVYLDAVRSSGKINVAEFDQLVDALNSVPAPTAE